MTHAETLGLISGLIAIVATSLYIRQVLHGHSTPNPVTWLVGGVVHMLNALSYTTMHGWDSWQLGSVSMVITCGILVICTIAWKRNAFAVMTRADAVLLIIALGIGATWLGTSNERLSNLLVQFLLVYLFVPTIVGLYNGTCREHPGAWSMGMFSYVFTIWAVVIQYDDWFRLEMVYPVVNGIICNGTIVVIALRQRRYSPSN